MTRIDYGEAFVIAGIFALCFLTAGVLLLLVWFWKELWR